MARAQRIYARALFEAAQGQGRLETVRSELAELRGAVAGAPDLRTLLENPEVDPRVKSDVLARVAEGSDVLVGNFVRLIAQKGRASELGEIADELDILVSAVNREITVELTTAQPVSDEEFSNILGQIEQASGRKVKATRKVDPNLIGGIVLQAGSMRLDASVSGRLERLRHQLVSSRS